MVSDLPISVPDLVQGHVNRTSMCSYWFEIMFRFKKKPFLSFSKGPKSTSTILILDVPLDHLPIIPRFFTCCHLFLLFYGCNLAGPQVGTLHGLWPVLLPMGAVCGLDEAWRNLGLNNQTGFLLSQLGPETAQVCEILTCLRQIDVYTYDVCIRCILYIHI